MSKDLIDQITYDCIQWMQIKSQLDFIKNLDPAIESFYDNSKLIELRCVQKIKEILDALGSVSLGTDIICLESIKNIVKVKVDLWADPRAKESEIYAHVSNYLTEEEKISFQLVQFRYLRNLLMQFEDMVDEQLLTKKLENETSSKRSIKPRRKSEITEPMISLLFRILIDVKIIPDIEQKSPNNSQKEIAQKIADLTGYSYDNIYRNMSPKRNHHDLTNLSVANVTQLISIISGVNDKLQKVRKELNSGAKPT
jgi:hypothetical protein